MLLAGCADGTAARTPISRDIPGPPDYLQPVGVREPAAGEFCEVVATRERRGRQRANVIIGKARRDWTAVRERYR